jgi:hypothetical protein
MDSPSIHDTKVVRDTKEAAGRRQGPRPTQEGRGLLFAIQSTARSGSRALSRLGRRTGARNPGLGAGGRHDRRAAQRGPVTFLLREAAPANSHDLTDESNPVQL